MQQFIQKIQELAKKEGITIANCHLKEILKNFNFFFYPDTLQTKEGIKQFENNYKIIVIDECIQNGIKYYVLCFDYNIIIFPNEDKAGDSILQDILKQFNGCVTYFIQNCNKQSDTDNSNSDFFKEIRNFSIKFSFRDKKLQSFWSMIVNCVSGFLIKKGYQNSRNKHDKYLNEKFVEHQEKRRNFENKSYIELRVLGRGSGGMVKLIYYISKEEVYALKLPHGNCDKLNKRERNNFLNIRYPYIVPYIGYIEFPYHPKYLLLEYVEGETLDKYNLANLNEQEKYIIIFELLLTIQYLHSQHYICRDLRCGNIMINQNKDAILIDFDHVLKDDDKNKETLEESKERTNNFIDPAVPDENKTYKSDIYSLSYIIHFILYGKPQKINDKLEINENFIFKSCLDTEPTKRPDIIKMTKIFCENIFFYIKFEDLKVQHLISLDPNHNIQEIQFNLGRHIPKDIKKGRYYLMLASKNNDRDANFSHGFLLHEGKCVKKDILDAIHYYKEASSFNNQYSKNNLGIIYKHGYNEIKGNIGNAIVYFEEAIRQKDDYLSMYNLAHIYMYDASTPDLSKSIDLLIRSMNEFIHSFILLSLALLLHFKFNIEMIKQELRERSDITESSTEKILYIINMSQLSFDELYRSYRDKDYLYNIALDPVLSSEVEHANEKVVPPKYPNAKELSSEFYKGFGEDL
ncbi:hypothetical protein M9Y10_003227 [Tritrichomonas musculus]|uniref:Protein kinase domain-containing protein n=1 Tax=Tritrichomonas musculus TaxID=1915356 RepID=A0ABR2JQP1_9EUKA